VKREFFIRKLAAVDISVVRPYSFATPAFAGCAICVGRIAQIYSYQGSFIDKTETEAFVDFV